MSKVQLTVTALCQAEVHSMCPSVCLPRLPPPASVSVASFVFSHVNNASLLGFLAPLCLQVDPAGVFVLPPGAVQELQLKLQPWQAGRRFMYVNAVEGEQHGLLAAWLLCLSIHRPVLSKVNRRGGLPASGPQNYQQFPLHSVIRIS